MTEEIKKIEEDVKAIVEDASTLTPGEGKMYSNSVPDNGEKKESVLKRIVLPHEKVSRLVTEEDIPKVIEEAMVLHAICFEQNGFYKGAYAMHHSQIDDQDPMQLFVTWDRKIVINPVIVRHSNYTKDSKEACMSFALEEQIIVQRWQKIEVEYTTIMSDPENEGKFKLSSRQTEALSGPESFIFQHEIDHGNGKLIYPIIEEKK